MRVQRGCLACIPQGIGPHAWRYLEVEWWQTGCISQGYTHGGNLQARIWLLLGGSARGCRKLLGLYAWRSNGGRLGAKARDIFLLDICKPGYDFSWVATLEGAGKHKWY